MSVTNATELFSEMLNAVLRYSGARHSQDPTSPMQELTVEAKPGSSFELRSIHHNVVTAREIDYRWAVANVLHFFAGTERAEPLLRYCKHAPRFLTGPSWIGAYGAIALPQIELCISLLQKNSATRRAVVTMGGPEHQDINRPACISFVHFLTSKAGLDMLVYQRSLSLWGVMPYDCVLLTNVLNYVAARIDEPPGSFRWVIGSLHCREEELERPLVEAARLVGLVLPAELLASPERCWDGLEDPSSLPEPWCGVLQ